MPKRIEEVSSPEKILGKERIAEICQGFQLEEADIEIVIRILRRWENLTGKANEKFAIGVAETSQNKKRGAILMALIAVTQEFAYQRTTTFH